MIVTFGDCQNRSCINITIVDDMVDEPVESFTYTLEMIPGSNSAICLEPVGGEVTIIDDDGRLSGCVPSKFHHCIYTSFYCPAYCTCTHTFGPKITVIFLYYSPAQDSDFLHSECYSCLYHMEW